MKTPLIAASAMLLAACAGYAPPKDLHVGTTEAEVVQAMGEPTGRYPLPDNGRRLEFARGPYGRHTYMIDLDAQGRVAQWDQVLSPRYFDVLGPGMTRDFILLSIGRPSDVAGMFRDGQIWSWRYANNDCLWWQAQFNAQGIVQSAGYAPQRGCPGDGSGNRN